jgi:histidinol-phosphatase (PHP family)
MAAGANRFMISAAPTLPVSAAGGFPAGNGILVDYHTHPMRTKEDLPVSEHLGHFEASMQRYAARAVELGLSELGFSEHIYRLSLEPGVVPWKIGKSPLGDIESYVAAVERVRAQQAQARAAGKPAVAIRLAMEVDIVPATVSLLETALPRFPFDYFLGSVHEVPDVDKDAPAEERYRGFYAATRWAAQSGLFHSIAHPDRIHRKNAALVELAFLEDEMERTAEVLASHHVSVEMSGSGIRGKYAGIDPHTSFIRICRRSGVTVTLGSDAHQLEVLGEGLPELRDVLWEAGFREIATFEGGRRTMRPFLAPNAAGAAAEMGSNSK